MPAEELGGRPPRHLGADLRPPAIGAGTTPPVELGLEEPRPVRPQQLRPQDVAGLPGDESALTGESLATGKRADPPDPVDAPLADRHTTLLAGTTVTRGTGRFVVTATGARTEMGRIAGAAEPAPATPASRQRTPSDEASTLG